MSDSNVVNLHDTTEAKEEILNVLNRSRCGGLTEDEIMFVISTEKQLLMLQATVEEILGGNITAEWSEKHDDFMLSTK